MSAYYHFTNIKAAVFGKRRPANDTNTAGPENKTLIFLKNTYEGLFKLDKYHVRAAKDPIQEDAISAIGFPESFSFLISKDVKVLEQGQRPRYIWFSILSYHHFAYLGFDR